MPKQGLTEIVTIIDKSGSMMSLKSRTIEGFNEFLNEQKKVEGEANFSLVLFGSPGRETIVFDSIDINEISELDENNYQPGGTTALYDCLGKTIKALRKRIKNLNEDERPERVLFVIITDGEENSSRLYNKEKVFEMISKREKKNGWAFIYLGANQDSFAEGGKMGVARGRTLNYAATDAGVDYAYANVTSFAKSYRMSSSVEVANNLSFDDVAPKKKETKQADNTK